jgi:hypothetical protein
MKIKVLISSLLLVCIWGCEEEVIDPIDPADPDPIDLCDVNQNQQQITSMTNDVTSIVQEVEGSLSFQLLNEYLNIEDAEVMNEDWVESMIEGLNNTINFEDQINNNNLFDFEANQGVYEWNNNTNTFDLSSNSNNIQISFPSSPTSIINNAIFTLSGYNDDNVFIDGENFFLPTYVNANLTVDGIEIFSLVSSISYDDPIPTSINTTIYVNPMTIQIQGQQVTPFNFEAQINIQTNNQADINFYANVLLNSDDYENLEGNNIENISTNLSVGDMTFNAFMNCNLIDFDDDVSTETINNATNVDVTNNGSVIANLELIELENGDYDVSIVHCDGTTESSEIYYEPFIQDVEDILYPYMGDWWN